MASRRFDFPEAFGPTRKTRGPRATSTLGRFFQFSRMSHVTRTGSVPWVLTHFQRIAEPDEHASGLERRQSVG